MIAHIIDDLWDMDFLVDLEKTLLEMPMHSTNVANPRSFPNGRVGSHRLFGTDVFVREGLNRVTHLREEAEIFFDAFKVLEEQIFNDHIFLRRIDVNLQYFGQDGTGHTDGSDDDDYTIMIMNCSQWKPEWGGQFQILDDTGEHVIEEHQYVPGRVLIFTGRYMHRGLAPTHPYVYRYTTVFKVRIDNIDDYF